MCHYNDTYNVKIKRKTKKGEKKMGLWMEWWKWAGKLRGACSRERTFMWLLVVGKISPAFLTAENRDKIIDPACAFGNKW